MASEASVPSGKSYVVVLLALVALTLASWGLSYVPLGAFAPVMGLSIGFVKAVLVALFFMHLYKAPFVLQIVVVVTAAFIVLLTFGMIADINLR